MSPKIELTVGSKAPNFALPSTTGKKISLKDYKGKKNIVLYFYPKDDTPGCTKEACSFRDSIKKFVKFDSVILGVSLDGLDAHEKFIKKYDLPFPLLSDEDAKVSKAYGVYKQKNMYGKKYWGIQRSTFVIDKQGKVKQLYRKVKVDGHDEEVLKAIRES